MSSLRRGASFVRPLRFQTQSIWLSDHRPGELFHGRACQDTCLWADISSPSRKRRLTGRGRLSVWTGFFWLNIYRELLYSLIWYSLLMVLVQAWWARRLSIEWLVVRGWGCLLQRVLLSLSHHHLKRSLSLTIIWNQELEPYIILLVSWNTFSLWFLSNWSYLQLAKLMAPFYAKTALVSDSPF